MHYPSIPFRALLPLGAALSLAACGTEQERAYEAGVTDVSGGELIVSEEDPATVPVTTPDTMMTPVAPGAADPVDPAAEEDPTVGDPTIGE